MRILATALCACACHGAAAAASAQTPVRPAIEAVASVSSSSDHADDPFVFLDLSMTWSVNDRVHVLVRPYARRLPGGDWDALFYQAQIRYQPADGVRVDAGIISSPLGLAALELRPDLNPTVGYPFYYFAPLPDFVDHRNRLQLLSGGYPVGAMISWSGPLLDARAAVTDGTPARYRKTFGGGAPALPQFVAGGGITPAAGLRVGAAVATGAYRREGKDEYFGGTTDDASDPWPPGPDPRALVLNVEAEFAFSHTRLSGEWVRDRFETEGSPAIATGFYVQAVQTLTPRTFAAARLTRATSPLHGDSRHWTHAVAEVAGGFRLSPGLTLRAGYQAAGGAASWRHSMLGSIVWAKRWF